MLHHHEKAALELLEPMASEAVVKAAKAATRNGTHVWEQDSLGTLGLVSKADWHTAVIVVYPAWTIVGSDKADFEVDEEWLEGAMKEEADGIA
jgi:hypothetical protein